MTTGLVLTRQRIARGTCKPVGPKALRRESIGSRINLCYRGVHVRVGRRSGNSHFVMEYVSAGDNPLVVGHRFDGAGGT